jgi:hypothetical protein
MITRNGGLVVTGYLTTTNENDTYPTHLDNLGKGGLHTVPNLLLRDSISKARRSEGMLCFVAQEASIYQLVGGIDNINWVLIYNALDGKLNFNIDCPADYVLTADEDNKIIASPVLLDARLDIVEMRKGDILIGHKNHKFPNAQVLNRLDNGFLYTTNGKVNTYPNIPYNKLPPLKATTISIGPFEYGIREMLQGSRAGTEASYDVWNNIIQFITIFKGTSWILGSRSMFPEIVDLISFPYAQFISDLPENSILTHTTKGIIGSTKLIPYDATYILQIPNENLPNAQVLADLSGGILKSDSDGVISIAISGVDYPSLLQAADAGRTAGGAAGALSGAAAGSTAGTSSGAAAGTISGTTAGTLAGSIAGASAGAASGSVAAAAAIAFLRLNHIPINGNLSVDDYKIVDLGNPTDPKDAVNLRTLNNIISANNKNFITSIKGETGQIIATGENDIVLSLAPTNVIMGDYSNPTLTVDNFGRITNISSKNLSVNIELQGDVTGQGSSGEPITTTLELTLDEIKIAQDTVNLNNQRIANLATSPVACNDALSFKFFWDLMHGEVEILWL